tara:strand:+ start:409 stop:855 length:447 start_codon:yes stop_codon:yes gene_type:complete
MNLENLDDLYEILDVDLGSDTDEIIAKYDEKIKEFTLKILNKKKLTSKDKVTIKNLKVAKFVLTDSSLRKNYDLLKIIEDSEENKTEHNEVPSFEYKEIEQFDVPLRKDKRLDYDSLSNRQFERFEHNNFDLSKDRQLRIAKLERKEK